MTQYTAEFKEEIVQKWYAGRYQSFAHFAREHNLPESTVSKWIRPKSGAPMMGPGYGQHPTLTTKINILYEWSQVSEDQRGGWLRTRGHTEEQLALWESEVAMTKEYESLEDKKRIKDLEKQNALLQKELRMKDKALADVTARLVLQKKMQDFFQGLEEDSSSQK